MTTPTDNPKPIDYIGLIAAYLPTEGIAVYITVATLSISSGTVGLLAVAVWSALAVNLLIALVTYAQTDAAGKSGWGAARVAIATTLLLALYLLVIPESAFFEMVSGAWGWELPYVLTAAAIVAVVLPAVAPYLGLKARKQEQK